MPIVPIGFVGPSATARSLVFDADRTVNFYIQQATSAGAQTPNMLAGTAGLALHCEFPTSPVRAEHSVAGRLFAVSGSGIYEVFADGTFTLRANLLTVLGPVGLSDNDGYLVLGDGVGFYTLDLTTFALAAVAGAPIGTWSAFIDGFTLFVEAGTGDVWYSNQDDPTIVDGLSFFNTESNPDTNVQIVVNGPEIWVFGQITIEVFYNSGNSDDPFVRISSGQIRQGLAAARTARFFDNSLVWIGRDTFGAAIVWRAQGYTPQRLSTYAVEYDLDRETDLSALTSIAWQEEGHSFYQINLPTVGTSWVFDAATGEWHERAWWNTATGLYERHRGEHHAYAFGQHFVGDYANGKLYRQSLGLYSDNGNPLRALRRVGTPSTGLQRVACYSLQVDMETGLAGATDPQMTLRVSTDGGRFWGNERTISIGAIGRTRTRAIWYRLGQGRDWAFEIVISDPVPRNIFGGQANIGVGTS